MPHRPLIGINLDYCPDGGKPNHPLLGADHQPATYSPFAHHSVGYNYTTAVERAGGVPLTLPHAFSAIERYVDMVDGFVFTGGLIDLPPEVYGEEACTSLLFREDQRMKFDMELMRQALASGKPLLGICAGHQLLNVLCGGTLYQHIPDSFPAGVDHFRYIERREVIHDVHIAPDSLLHRVTGAATIGVNSSHHMAVHKVGPQVKISATAPDGVPEAIELTNHPFAIGVQWHPEYFSAPHQNLFEQLVVAAQEGRQS